MKARNQQIDGARGVLIVLVVWGHLLESKGFDGRLYFAIYTFHMPALVLISGLVAKSHLDLKDLAGLVQRIVMPLIVFQALYYYTLDYFAPDRALFGTAPAWIMWFLLSLLVWRLLLPLVVRIPHALFLSIVAALVAGTVDWIGYEYGLSRTFFFFPAFLFGHFYGARSIFLVTQYRAAFGFLFLALFFGAFGSATYFDIYWLWGFSSYSELGAGVEGAVYRFSAILLGIVMSISLFALIPVYSRLLAQLGQRTMPIYLLHGFLVVLFWSVEVDGINKFEHTLLTAVLAIIIAYLLAQLNALSGTAQIFRTRER